MHCFAYGSNCNPAVMERKGVRVRSRRRATLPGFRLRFNKRAERAALPDDIGFANIEASPGDAVEGVLYDVHPDDLERLDASERHPEHYRRLDVTVETDGGPVAAFAYQAQPDKLAEGLRPSRNYLDHILQARDFLSRSYFEALEASQTYEGACACCERSQEVVFLREGERLWMICQPCRESRVRWGAARGRPLTVAETTAVLGLVRERGGFPSVLAAVEAATAEGLLAP